MHQLGSLGEFTFTVLRAPRAIGRTRSWTYAQHAVAGRAAVLEATGREATEAAMRIQLTSVQAGGGLAVNPSEELAGLVSLAESREAHPLFVGSEYWGRFVIEQIREDVRRVAPGGEMLSVEVELSLREQHEVNNGN